jgi:hypothetical protein
VVESLRVTGVLFRPAGATEVASGLLGWCDFTVNDGLRLSGVCMRKTRSGKLTLSYPARTGPGGRSFPVRPADDAARVALERQVFAALSMVTPAHE